MSPTDREVTLAQAAELLGCHPETVRRWVLKGELPARRRPFAPGRPLVIKVEDLDALAKRRSER